MTGAAARRSTQSGVLAPGFGLPGNRLGNEKALSTENPFETAPEDTPPPSRLRLHSCVCYWTPKTAFLYSLLRIAFKCLPVTLAVQVIPIEAQQTG